MKAALLILGLIISATALATNSGNLKNFFSKNKIGYSSDYGVFKNGKDYIISVHGFDKDLDICLEIIEMLNKEQPNTYSCKPLNH